MNNLEIKKIRKELGKSQKEFAKMLGVGDRAVQTWESGERNISQSAEILLKMIINNGEQSVYFKNEAIEISPNYIKVPTIPVHAQAGFLAGYGDEAYWSGLPTEIWEVDREYKGNYVVFEVRGDSMDDNSVNAILEGDRILCREIQQQHWYNKLHVNKWNFVIVHREEGVIIKRITEHDVENGVITCHSLNPYYDDFKVNLKDVVALYNVVDLKRNLRL